NPTFVDLLGRVKTAALGAYAHQDLPFERLVDALDVRRDLGRPPLFDVMLVLQEAGAPSLSLRGLAIEQVRGAASTGAKFDLTLSLEHGARGLVGSFEYDAELLEEATIRRMARHFEALVRAAVRAPSTRIGDLRLLAEEERRQVLVEWNDSAAEFPRSLCVHDL